jgi:NADP-dependent 3-hydroxy acid dehydrogenase YdfG
MSEKVVVITGASSGIGAELAKLLSSQGHRIVLAARSEEKLKLVAAQCKTRTITVATDVTKREDVENLRDTALNEFGAVDVWVNDAGRGINKHVMELTDEDLDQMISVNLKSVLYGAQAIIPYFQEEGAGHLITVSSFLGRVPIAANRSAYNVAKHGVNALVANLRMDLGATHPRIRVSLVMPGVVETDFAKNALHSPAQPTAHSGAAGFSQTPQEVAAKIAGLLESPVAEIYTNPNSAQLAQDYFKDVQAFEENLLKRMQGAGSR